jgi:hypothetical protein
MKPYAWINVNDEYKILFDDELPTHYPEAWMPLYTHPAKTLTDEEIRHLQAQCHLKNVGYDTFIMRFAKAILKKSE